MLARNPSLALAPVDVSVVSYDVLGSVDAVNALRKSAEDALEDGRLQEARHLIDGLASETVVRVSNLPLATYPDAIKAAAVLVAQNKLDEAKAALEAGKHVLCEKPLTTSVAQAQELTALAQANGLRNATCHNLRYYPMVQHMRRLREAGHEVVVEPGARVRTGVRLARALVCAGATTRG